MKKNLEYRIKIQLVFLFLFVPFLNECYLHKKKRDSNTVLDFANAHFERGFEIDKKLVSTSLSMDITRKMWILTVKYTIHANRGHVVYSHVTYLLKNTNTTYSRVLIIICSLFTTKETPTVHSTMQQNTTPINGTVSDEYGEPLIGLN